MQLSDVGGGEGWLLLQVGREVLSLMVPLCDMANHGMTPTRPTGWTQPPTPSTSPSQRYGVCSGAVTHTSINCCVVTWTDAVLNHGDTLA